MNKIMRMDKRGHQGRPAELPYQPASLPQNREKPRNRRLKWQNHYSSSGDERSSELGKTPRKRNKWGGFLYQTPPIRSGEYEKESIFNSTHWMDAQVYIEGGRFAEVCLYF